MEVGTSNVQNENIFARVVHETATRLEISHTEYDIDGDISVVSDLEVRDY